ncbi:MAG: hypothetical protein Q8L69_05585 [Gallionellaceae bacterium]|nr:hypothetical protein [Gallionellaceae bacterium]
MAGSLSGAGLALLSGWTLGWVVLALALLMAGSGLWDDFRHIPAKWRFGMQVVATSVLLATAGDLPRVDLPFGITPHGWVLLALLLLTGLWWINLFNFMDGIDGIAATQAIFMLGAGAVLAALGQPGVIADPVWVWMLCIAAAAAGFLLLNWPPAKIFMGGIGSMYLGFMIFVFALYSVQAGWLSYTAWLVLGALFVADATVTLLTRVARGERWYEAHRNHAYQRLARQWGGHRPVTLLAMAVNGLWLMPLAWACLGWPQWAWGFVAIAYAPLVVGAALLRAGRPD